MKLLTGVPFINSLFNSRSFLPFRDIPNSDYRGYSIFVKFSLLLCCWIIINPCRASGDIVINEIYYDHPGSDSGYEYIELYNCSGERINLEGLRIIFADGRTGGQRLFYQFGSDCYIPGKTVFLTGGIEFNGNAAYEPLCVLQNGPDAVLLEWRGLILDRVGYGEIGSPDMFESSPAPDIEAGRSLSRKPDGRDSDDNSRDFVPAEPSPGRVNFYDLDTGISIRVNNPLPCRGGYLEMEMEVASMGIRPFTGSFEVLLSIPTLCNRIIEAEMSEGKSAVMADLRVRVPFFMDSLEVTASLTGQDFGNRQNDVDSMVLFTSPGDLVINEVMYRPRGSGSEWIEIYNTGERSLNLNGYRISDANGRLYLITGEDIRVDPEMYAVLAEKPGILTERVERDKITGLDPFSEAENFRVIVVEGGWPVLNDYPGESEPEIITIRDRFGRFVEKIEYCDLLEGERGISIERYSSGACSSCPGGLWHRAVCRGGSTPGRENSVAGIPGSSLKISPNPFIISRSRKVLISGRKRAGMEGVLIRIYDMNGMEVVRLFGEKRGADYYAFYWDGNDSRGDPVNTGLYICVAEYFSEGGDVMGREKKCIAVSSGVF